MAHVDDVRSEIKLVNKYAIHFACLSRLNHNPNELLIKKRITLAGRTSESHRLSLYFSFSSTENGRLVGGCWNFAPLGFLVSTLTPKTTRGCCSDMSNHLLFFHPSVDIRSERLGTRSEQ
jgi:hypothetical protein